MSPDGEVLDTWYGRSVICSATKLAYEHAQDMLDNPEKVRPCPFIQILSRFYPNF